jgi:hypothetical protein
MIVYIFVNKERGGLQSILKPQSCHLLHACNTCCLGTISRFAYVSGRDRYRSKKSRYWIPLSFFPVSNTGIEYRSDFFRYWIPVLSTALIFSGTEYRYWVPLRFFPVLDTGIEDFLVLWYWIPVLDDWRYMYKFLALQNCFMFFFLHFQEQ